jgi:hypothetical protein
VRAGHRTRLRLVLNARGARMLDRERRLQVRLAVTQTLGMTAARKQIYSRIVTLRRRPSRHG